MANCSGQNNAKLIYVVGHKERSSEDVDAIYLAEDTVQLWDLVNTLLYNLCGVLFYLFIVHLMISSSLVYSVE
jgi:hypothetical protein